MVAAVDGPQKLCLTFLKATLLKVKVLIPTLLETDLAITLVEMVPLEATKTLLLTVKTL